MVAPEAAVDAAVKKDMPFPALAAWGQRDLVAAMARFEQLTSITGFSAASMRDNLFKLAMPKPGQLPPSDAMRGIMELQADGPASPAVMNSMSAIVRDWAKTDPEAAWREALSLPADGKKGETRAWALDAILSVKVGSDPQAALRWVEALEDVGDREKLQAFYVSALALKGNLREAQSYALALPEGEARRRV